VSEEVSLPATIPYSTDPADLMYPGRAPDFFDPRFGPAPSDAALCAEMARLAYLRHEDPGGAGRLEAVLRDRAQFELEARFDAAGTQGFTASGRAPNGDRVIVVAFRGTEPAEASDLRQDARFWPRPWGADAQVHTGFAEALGVVRDQVLYAIGTPPGRLLLTGHSLGAAVAALTASLVPLDRRAQTMLCTFGSPRVGDQRFGESLAGITHVRYAGACDLVSWVPPVGLLVPYRHHGIFRCIDRTGRVHELGAGEAGDEQAAWLRAPCTREPIAEIFLKLLARQVPAQELSDHAPINYVSAIWGLRS
jgi:hypothetical protein